MGNSTLDYGRSVKEEDLRFGFVYTGTRGIREDFQDRFEGCGFLNRRIAEKHIIIHELLMGNDRGIVNG